MFIVLAFQAMIPLKSLEEEPDMETSNESTALQIEHDTLQEVSYENQC